jgi:arginine:ornithine antiporter / lysine permease
MGQTHSSLPLKPVAADTVVAQHVAQPGGRNLSLPLLTSVVIASMIGGGAFNLPQNMAHGAGLAAIEIAWTITLVGMFSLSNTFRTLAEQDGVDFLGRCKDELRSGI